MILVGEIGINHDGSLEKALQLIDQAKATGFNVVKFQKRTPRLCVPEDEWNKEKISVFGKTTYIEYKEKIEFGQKEYDIIDDYCKKLGILWTASVWDIPSLIFIQQYNIPFIKIPSACLTDDELIIEAIQTDIPIVLGTGMSTEEEIDHAVSLFPGNYPLALLHCNSSYPCYDEDINLDYMNILRKKYPNNSIGYSGHEIGIFPTLLAAAMGADMIERHITYDCSALGSDHKCSLDYSMMQDLNKFLKDVYKIKGEPKKNVSPTELKMAKKLRNK